MKLATGLLLVLPEIEAMRLMQVMCEFMKEAQWVEYNIGAEFDGEAMDDYLGFPVSIDSMGNRVAICATLNDGNGVDAGHVRVYEWNSLGSDRKRY